MENELLRTQLSELMVKHHLRTDQVFLNEVMRLLEKKTPIKNEPQLSIGKEYVVVVKKQVVRGEFLREVSFLFWKRYDFLVEVHVKDMDYKTEYNKNEVFRISKKDILTKKEL